MSKINMLMIVFVFSLIIWEGESGQFTLRVFLFSKNKVEKHHRKFCSIF